MGRVIEIDITPEIPWAETAEALDWCKRFNRSWQDAKLHRQKRVAVYRANVIEPLERRRILSISSLSIAGLDPPVEGHGTSTNFTYSTDHNDVDSGYAHANINFGDGTTSSFDVTSGTTGIGHTYTEEGTYTLSVFVRDDNGYNTYNNTSWDGGSESSTATIVVGDADLDAGSAVTIAPMMTTLFTGVVGHYTDENSYDDDSDFTASIDWGDGTDPTNGTISGGDVSGTHTYAAAGTYSLTVYVDDPAGSSVELSGTANVWKPTLNSITAADHVDTTNSLTADSSHSTRDLYLAQNSSSQLVFGLGASISPSGSPANHLVLWKVTSGSASPSSGSFATANTITLSTVSGSYNCGVKAGVDANADGTLEDSEVGRELDIKTINISTKEISHNNESGDLPAADEKSPGAFVPINNDDDNYDGIPDYENTGAVTGEDDLLPVVLHAVGGANPGNYTVSGSGALHVFLEHDRSSALTAGTPPFSAASDTTLWLEGTEPGVDTFQIDWSNGTQTVHAADHIKVTTFWWSGALDVPGYAAYEYDADGALSTSHWTTPSGGTITAGAGTSTAMILWGAGADVEKAAYQVNSSYTWDLEVNVVEVTVSTSGSSATYGGNPQQSSTLWINASTTGEAIDAHVDVSLTGPVVDGIERGIAFVDVGFIQNANFEEMHADFDNGQRRRWIDEGSSYFLDNDDSSSPWYDDTNAWSNTYLSGEYGSSSSLEFTDTPELRPTDVMELSGAPATSFALVFNCNVYVAVHTTQDVNGSADVYTQRAKLSWTFNGSGEIDTGRWSAGPGAGDSGSSTFTPVTDGSLVPVTGGRRVNDMITEDENFGGHFETVNQ